MLPVKKHEPSRAGMLLNYSALHLLTDGVCASVMLGSVLMHADAEKIAGLFLLYNLIAFCGQALTGALCDRLGSLHAAVRLSALLTAWTAFVLSASYQTVGIAISTAILYIYSASGLPG